MDLFTIALGAAVILILVLYRHLTKNQGWLESLGIPVIAPTLFGSPPFNTHGVIWHEWIKKQHDNLGLNFGHYSGIIPVVYSIDPDIVKAVYVKNFEEFGDMYDSSGMKDRQVTLDLATGDRWKTLRKILSPTFTSGKLKAMLEPMGDVADKTMIRMEQLSKEGKEVPMKATFQCLALDTICKCAFGMETNANEDPENELIKTGRAVFQGFQSTNWGETIFMHLLYLFPGLEGIIPGMLPAAWDKLFDITESIVKQRDEKNLQYGDFIDRIREVRNNTKDYNNISKDLITAQGIIFFAAGFETTAHTLTTLSYNLTKNPDIQEKVYDEIQNVLASHEEINHETIADMHYLEAAINETLRMYPPAALQERLCSKDVEIKGIKFVKGSYVRLPIYASHMNPDFFPDPEQFQPERFLKENEDKIIPFTYRPFSGGPRLCLGQRFAMIEMKVCMAKLVNKFKLMPTEKTEMKMLPGDLFMTYYDEVNLKLIPR